MKYVNMFLNKPLQKSHLELKKLPSATKQPATLGMILGFGVVRCQATRFLAHTFACVCSASPRCPLSSVHGMTDQVD